MWLMAYPSSLLEPLSCLVMFLDGDRALMRATDEGVLLDGAVSGRAGRVWLAKDMFSRYELDEAIECGIDISYYTEWLQCYLRRPQNPVELVLERGDEFVLMGRPVVSGGVLSFRKRLISPEEVRGLRGFDEIWAERDVRARVRLHLDDVRELLKSMEGACTHVRLEFDGKEGRLLPCPLNGKRLPFIELGGHGKPVHMLLSTEELHCVARGIPSSIKKIEIAIGHTLSYELALGEYAHGWFVMRWG